MRAPYFWNGERTRRNKLYPLWGCNSGSDAFSTLDEQLQIRPESEQHGITFESELVDPWNRDQYNEHRYLGSQTVLDSSYWMQHLPSTRSVQDTPSNLSSFPQESTTQAADRQKAPLKRSSTNNQRIHKCTTPSCNALGFKKLADLRCHQRSREGSRFFCSVASCKAHTMGFKRKDNLTAHHKRIHGINSSIAVSTMHSTTQDTRAVSTKDEGREKSTLAETLTEIKNGSDINSPAKDFLQAKLAELHASRERLIAEKDEEIRAVELTLSLM
ncbi:hypothetical protein DID88_004809 [Monilinia fructigena]|uniref:C2H2-type domain-containing protein n=1 Tax=Monilinia fructigena TaxID=38457 RepID=A0A395IV67_9HELO|nr:hypothetical protein DID88_004809 [Monilinia fructigena]